MNIEYEKPKGIILESRFVIPTVLTKPEIHAVNDIRYFADNNTECSGISATIWDSINLCFWISYSLNAG